MPAFFRLCGIGLLIAFASACSIGSEKLEPEYPKRKSVVPGPVTGVTAKIKGYAIVLEWPSVEHADGYAVYRTQGGGAPKLIDKIPRAAFRDFEVQHGQRYVYEIAAYNSVGEGPNSEPVEIHYIDPYAEWVRAPYDPPSYGYSPDPTVPTWPGGDDGDASVSTFASTGVSGCTAAGYEIVSLRPSTEASLVSPKQTIEVTVAYNLNWSDAIEFELQGTEGRYGERSIDERRIEVGPGCGKTTYTRTVDTSSLLPNEEVLLGVYLGYYYGSYDSYRIFRFDQEGMPRIDFVTSFPAAKETLIGSYPLQVTIDHRNLQPGTYRFEIGSYWYTLGATEVSLAGTGTTVVELPYDLACGGSTRLSVWGPAGKLHVRNAPYYGSASSADMYTQLDGVFGSEFSSVSDFGVAIGIGSCSSYAAKNISVTAGEGFKIRKYDWYGDDTEIGKSVTGTTDHSWVVLVDETYPWEMTSYAAAVTVDGPGGARTLDFDFHVFGFYMETVPPQNAVTGLEYPVSATVENIPPFFDARISLQSYADFSYAGVVAKPMARQGNLFTTAVKFSHCGVHALDLKYAVRESYEVERLATYDIVEGNDSRLVDSPPSSGFDSYEGFEEKEVTLTGNCSSGSTTWKILSAPPWLRFERLAGTTDEKVRFVLDRSKLVGNYDSDSIYFESASGKITTHWVSYDYYDGFVY